MARICFVSYEIHPTTAGGAGVLIHNTAQALLADGHEVILVLDIPRHEFEQFVERDRLDLPHPERCRAYDANSMLPGLQPGPEDFSSEAHWKSYRFDMVCRQVCERETPDIIECFDYCGSAWSALQAKVAGLAYEKTHISVRLHMTLEVIDSHEAVTAVDGERHLMYGLEHAALRLAESVLYPSREVLDEAVRPFYEEWLGMCWQASPVVLRWPERVSTDGATDKVLFYGRLFGLKGVDDFVDAAVANLTAGFGQELRYVLVGYDSMRPPTPEHGTYQQFLEARIPEEWRGHFEFRGFMDWNAVSELLRNVRFAVFPNRVESFCYAAQELRAAGVPLLVSSIPAFRGAFSDLTDALFYDGTVGDLAVRMRQLDEDDDLRQRLTQPRKPTNHRCLEFYRHHPHASWIEPGDNSCEQGELVVLVLCDGETDNRTEVLPPLAGMARPTRTYCLKPGSGVHGHAAWFLGQLYEVSDGDNRPVEPGALRLGDYLLILRASDECEQDFVSTACAILDRQPEVGFVGGWWRNANGRVDTFPFDAVLETVAFSGRSPYSRCMKRTASGSLLNDVFDDRLGIWGELRAFWELEDAGLVGITIPGVVGSRSAEQDEPASAELASYLIAHAGTEARRRRLARYGVAMRGQTETVPVSRAIEQQQAPPDGFTSMPLGGRLLRKVRNVVKEVVQTGGRGR